MPELNDYNIFPENSVEIMEFTSFVIALQNDTKTIRQFKTEIFQIRNRLDFYFVRNW